MKHLRVLRAFLFIDAVVLLVFIGGYFWLSINRNYWEYGRVMVYILAVILTVLLAFTAYYGYHQLALVLTQEQLAKKTDPAQFEESQKLIHVLKSQRHDFRNHLQVIKVLAQLNKNNEIVQYIQDCDIALDFTNSIATQIDNPVMSAMLLIFSAQAKEKNIGFNVDSDLDFDKFVLPPAKITSIIGNIIQNAIEALEQDKLSERSIQVTIWETADFYFFLIWNNGPVIHKNVWEKMFTPGFSTKSSTGLGLSIAKELVAELGGKITVTSTKEFGTEFKIAISKTNNRAQQLKTGLI